MRWKGQGEIRSGDYTVYYSGGERAERGAAIVVHKSVVRSVVKIVCNDRIIAIKLKAEPVSILIMHVYMATSDVKMMKWKNCMTQLKKFLRKMEKVTQTTSYWGTGITLLEMSHIGTLLDQWTR